MEESVWFLKSVKIHNLQEITIFLCIWKRWLLCDVKVGRSLSGCSCFWCYGLEFFWLWWGFLLDEGFLWWLVFGIFLFVILEHPEKQRFVRLKLQYQVPTFPPAFSRSCVHIPGWKYNQRLDHIIRTKTYYLFVSVWFWLGFLICGVFVCFFVGYPSTSVMIVFKINATQANKLHYSMSVNSKTCLMQLLESVYFSKTEWIVVALKYISF